MMRSIYVIGLKETGGCWIPVGKCYRSWDAAKEQLDKERDKDYPCQIFTLEVQDEQLRDS